MTLTPVRVRDCTCPETPHEGHNVFVRPTISLEGGIAAEKAMRAVALTFPSAPAGETKEAKATREATQGQALIYEWAPIFVRDGAVGWDLCDEHGDPIPFDVNVILGDYAMARLVAEKCNELGYGDAVIAPFRERPAKPSRNGRTPATTSRRPTQTPS